MNFPQDLRYSKDHEWIRLENGNQAVIGITEFAQRELGDIVFVDVPTVGKALDAEEVFGTVEAVKAVSDLFPPGSRYHYRNKSRPRRFPELLNQESYTGGWIIKLTVKNTADLDKLMDAAAYSALVGE